jgi:hypothetical protein
MVTKKLLIGLAAVLAVGGAAADPVTFTGFANGSQAVRGVLGAPNVSRDLTVSAGGFNTLWGGDSFVSYCVDFYQWLPSFGSTNNSYSLTDAGGFFGSRLDDVSRLFSGRSAEVDTPVEQAAFQIALWEIKYEAAGNGFDTQSGAAMFSDYGDDARSLAQTYLNGLSRYSNSFEVRVLKSEYNQDVVFAAPVPEPSTYALMLAGLAAVGFMARRQRQAKG